MSWLLLILSLPTENATARMRAWRALKACGAAVLRDGVYLLPERESCRAGLERIVADVQAHGGSAHLLTTGHEDGFPLLFDRRADFATLLEDIRQLHAQLAGGNAADAIKPARKLRKAFTALADIDFFPADSQPQTLGALEALERHLQQALGPDEPQFAEGTIALCLLADYQQCLWATRQRPWVDRLASAWLIRRFIDPAARFLWLPSPADCPPDALGFDFDGATFTHIGDKVTFEVLLASFAVQQPGLQRMAALVHYLDAGGIPVQEAPGLQAILDGLRCSIADDDALLNAALTVFDSLLTHFSNDASP